MKKKILSGVFVVAVVAATFGIGQLPGANAATVHHNPTRTYCVPSDHCTFLTPIIPEPKFPKGYRFAPVKAW